MRFEQVGLTSDQLFKLYAQLNESGRLGEIFDADWHVAPSEAAWEKLSAE